MWNHTAVALLFCAVSISVANADEPSLLRLAPPDSEVLIGINVQQIRESDFGKMIASQAAVSGNPQFKAFSEKAGFDPLKDLNEVLITAPAKQKPNAFLMMRGRFDAAKLQKLATEGGMKASEYLGVTIMSKPEQQEGLSAVAVINSSLIVGGDLAGVRAFVARFASGREPAGLSPAVAAKAAEVSKANDIWVLLHAAPSTFVPAGAIQGPMGDLVQSIEQVTLGLKFGSDIVLALDAVTHTPKDAEGLAGAVRMFSGMAAANQQGNKQVAALLQRLKVDSDGNTAKLSLAIPEAEAEAAIRDAITSKAKASQQSAPAPAKAAVTPLGLKVERSGGQLELIWDRNAPAVAAATRGMLTITDADHIEDVDLDVTTLHSGRIVYSPISNDVNFVLELFDRTGKSLTEQVRHVQGKPQPAPATNATQPAH
jgi:hypothetical protein